MIVMVAWIPIVVMLLTLAILSSVVVATCLFKAGLLCKILSHVVVLLGAAVNLIWTIDFLMLASTDAAVSGF
jgi:hypothetical protein